MGAEDLVRHMTAALADHHAMRGLFLGGSFGSGEADAFSDLDFILLADPSSHDELEGAWCKAVEAYAPVVFWNRRSGNGILLLNAITERWVRCDVYLTRPSDFARRARNQVRPIIDRDGAYESLPQALPLRAPDPQRVSYLVNEFIRVLGLMHVGLGRGEYFLLAGKGLGHLRDLLTSLLLEKVTVPDRGGALHLSRLLPAEELQMLNALPFPPPQREAVIEAHLAFARAFFPRARSLVEELGLEWPEAFEAATRNFLLEAVGTGWDLRW
ncbi:hypothetical protein AB2N04_09510 [Nitratireductor sp. GISD-1A_MAKvit]|uniref:hypothetical protein n=1 Tax=Nitratireductor sp. GISD-1A_MAKvit TaxID=3234198 RepID=UPI00346614CF